MTRILNTATLDQAARDMAGAFLAPSRFSQVDPDRAVWGRDWVIQSLYNATFKDEFEHLIPKIKGFLGPDAVAEFDALAAATFTPRDDDVFAQLLEEKLAIRPDGSRIEGAVGTTQIGDRLVLDAQGRPVIREKVITLRGGRTRTVPKFLKERVYAGQEEMFGMGADVTNISAECALLGLDAVVDNLDEGTGAAVIQGRSGAQPADPDVAVTGTLLFTLTCSATAFGAAADQADGTADAAAAAITDDSSADATGTLGYCRASSTNDGSTPFDDHIDGVAGTSGASFNFNTLSIVSGATVAMSSWVVTWSQGSTAT